MSADLSSYFGIFSICCWICCLIPQFVMNCLRKKRSNLSRYLFIFWFIGDSLNLVGSILTKQLPFQQISSIFYVIMDILNLIQYIYLTKVAENIINDEDSENSEDSESFIRSEEIVIRELALVVEPPIRRYLKVPHFLLVSLMISPITSASPLLNGLETLETLETLRDPLTNDITNNIGLICGILASFMYIGSRIVQLRKIIIEKSVEGLIMNMFIFAIFGNISTITAILLKPDLNINSLPWIIGSSIVLVFDIIIIGHFLKFP